MMTNKHLAMKPENFVGTVVGSLTVLKFVGQRQNLWYIVECTCGRKERVLKQQLLGTKRKCTKCQNRIARRRHLKIVHHLLRNLNTDKEVA